jgi:hypothetical protein
MPTRHAAPLGWGSPSALAGLLVAIAGCCGTPPAPVSRGPAGPPPAEDPAPALAPADREAVTRCLRGVALGQGVRVRPGPGGRLHVVTVEEALAELGARAGEDGKVRDRDGKEILFWRNPLSGRGTPWSNEEARAVQAELEELKRQYTVIEFDYYPGEENGDPPPIVCSPAR